MSDIGFPDEVLDGIKGALDCRPEFNGHVVSVWQMVGIMVASIVVFGGIYLLFTFLPDKEK